MAEVAGVGAEQEIDALSLIEIDQESEWNGTTVIHLHQPTFFFVNFENFEDYSESRELKLRISGTPDAVLLERIRQLLEMKGLGDAKIQLDKEDLDPILVKA